MKKNISAFIILVISFALFMLVIPSGCKILPDNSESVVEDIPTDEKPVEVAVTDEEVAEYRITGEDMIFKEETAPEPPWIKNQPTGDNKGPWFESLYIAVSQDGLNFTDRKMFLEHAGVANLIYTSGSQLIATFQYFSYVNEDMFDVIAYSVSKDFGSTWSEVRPVMISGLGKGPNPVDPTLVELDDGTFRLYFTYHEHGSEYPQLFSAVGDSMEGEFKSEGQQLTADGIILDPAVVKFGDVWHHYTVKHGTEFGTEPGNFVNVHSISETGTYFQQTDDIEIDMDMLGDVILDNNGLRFYSGFRSAFSEDGYNWTIDSGERVDGADPGVAKLPDGSYIIIYTRM